jgi:hypothetical protein
MSKHRKGKIRKVDPGLVQHLFLENYIYFIGPYAYKITQEHKSISSFETWLELNTKTFFGVLAKSFLYYGLI